MRQQQTHQQSSNANSLKSSNRSSASCSSSSSSARHPSNVGNSNTNNNNNSKSSSASGMPSSGALTKTTNSSSSMKHGQGGSQTSSSNSNNHLTHQNSNNNNNNNNTTNNGLAAIGHNSSPILPMTPTSSVSPPVNVICKKELNTNYHSGNNGVPGLTDVMKSTSMHDSLKEEMVGMVATNPGIAYSNINARLGHAGNSTPLGSNSSIITTPSPPMTPSQNALSYVPNHDSYSFWQYNQYQNNYNPAYYSQVDYPNQSNYGMGHSGYSASNMGLSSGNAFNGSMASQPFGTNGIDGYTMTPDKYVNMV